IMHGYTSCFMSRHICYTAPHLHSFPTRRSSDLDKGWCDPTVRSSLCSSCRPGNHVCEAKRSPLWPRRTAVLLSHGDRGEGPSKSAACRASITLIAMPSTVWSWPTSWRSEEHTSELQSRSDL